MRLLAPLAFFFLLGSGVLTAQAQNPRPSHVHLATLPGMHLQVAIPPGWLYRYHYNLLNFQERHARYKLQGLFTTVSIHPVGNGAGVRNFTVAFLQNPQQLTLTRYISAYLGGVRQFHLTWAPGLFGNANGVFRAHNDAAIGNQAYFIRFDGHVYWLSWGSAPGFWRVAVARYFRSWHFTR